MRRSEIREPERRLFQNSPLHYYLYAIRREGSNDLRLLTRCKHKIRAANLNIRYTFYVRLRVRERPAFTKQAAILCLHIMFLISAYFPVGLLVEVVICSFVLNNFNVVLGSSSYYGETLNFEKTHLTLYLAKG
jgi:hypothetical protein